MKISKNILIIVFLLILSLNSVSVYAIYYSDSVRIVRTDAPAGSFLESVSKAIIEEWDIDSQTSIEGRIEQLVEKLEKKGIDSLLQFEGNLIVWTELLRHTVLKEEETNNGGLVKQLQDKVDTLLLIMHADNLEDILSEIEDEEVAGVLNYFVHDAGIDSFQELRLSSDDIENLVEAFKKGLDFEGWLPLWLTVQPSLWIKKNIEYKDAIKSLERFKQSFVETLKVKYGILDSVNLVEKRVSIDSLVPTHHIDIYEGDSSASYRARLAELKKGIMIPFETIKYVRSGKAFIANGQSRAYAAYKLGLKTVEVWMLSFEDQLIEEYSREERSTKTSGLFSVRDIPEQTNVDEKTGERIAWKRFLDVVGPDIIRQKWNENKVAGKPTLIGSSGSFLSGRNTIVEKLMDVFKDFSDGIDILDLDHYLLSERKKILEREIDLPDVGKKIKVPHTSISIRRKDNNMLEIENVFGRYIFKIRDVGIEAKLPGTHIYISRPAEDKIFVRLPEFLARFELGRFYEDIKKLREGKSIFVPVCCDFVKKDRLYIEQEEIETLEEKGAEQITIEDAKLIRHPGLPDSLAKEYGDDIWINMGTGEVVWRLVPETNLIFIEGPHALHRPEINEVYDLKLFTVAMRHLRRGRAITRHILLGEDEDLTIPEVVAKFEESREREDYIESEQANYADYIVNNNQYFSEEQYTEIYGSLEERIDKGIKVASEEEVDKYTALEYIQYCISPHDPLEDALGSIVARHISGTMELQNFLERREHILRKKTGILINLLIRFDLLPSTFRLH